MKKLVVLMSVISCLLGCEYYSDSYEVTSGSEIDVYATLSTASDDSQTIKVEVQKDGETIQISNGTLYFNGSTEITFSSDLSAYYNSSVSIAENETCTISIVLNEGDDDEVSYDETTINYLGVPTITAQIGASYGSLGDVQSFPTTISSSSGLNILVDSNYTSSEGDVIRSDGTTSSTSTYADMDDRYFTPRLIAGSDINLSVTSIEFDFTTESSGSIDSSFNSGSAVSEVALTKTVTVETD